MLRRERSCETSKRTGFECEATDCKGGGVLHVMGHYARFLWLYCLLILLNTIDLSWEGKIAKKRKFRIPLMRSKRDLQDSLEVPTENLKGRPGQGYYISTLLGSPPQRVSIYISKLSSVASFFHCYPKMLRR